MTRSAKDRVVEKELRDVKAENAALRKQVGRLRKQLSKLEPISPEESAEPVPEKKQDAKNDDNACPRCSADLATLKTPNSTLSICKACGYRKKV